mmetsp:Transcript_46032/g.84402  ORF Transcript_46032/g.84402 Transcript_46032/m.84402 type:complete len:194 (+) Transcript_46032:73-654(+)
MAACAPAAASPDGSNVVQATIVGATVVQATPVAATAVPVGNDPNQPGLVMGQPVVGQPVLQGTPMQPPVMMGMSPLTPEEQHQHNMRQQDDTGTILGWALYITGWFVCCCCGPFGPVFWLGIAAIHYCKPKEQRDQLPQEKIVAVVSMVTGIFCSVVIITVIILLVVLRDSDSEDDGSSSSDRGDQSNRVLRI